MVVDTCQLMSTNVQAGDPPSGVVERSAVGEPGVGLLDFINSYHIFVLLVLQVYTVVNATATTTASVIATVTTSMVPPPLPTTTKR